MSATQSVIDPNQSTFDIFLVVAFILFIVAAVVGIMKRPFLSIVACFGLASTALAFMFLT